MAVSREVFISTSSFSQFDPAPLKLLNEKKVKYTVNPYHRTLNEVEIDRILHEGSYGGLIAGLEPLTANVLEKAKALKVISRVGVGVDNIDQAAAKKLKIKVYNTPNVLADSVAELTIGLILSSLRKIPLADQRMHKKVWKKEMGALFRGKTLGIVGLGSIGKRVAQLAKGFGAKVVFSDVRTIKQSGCEQLPFKKLLKTADIISLHASGGDQLIGEAEIAAMRDDVILVNTSRGSLIDENALYDALLAGKVAQAALDVYGREPYPGKLTQLDNTILTPHIGSYAREARIKMEVEAVKNLIKGLKNQFGG